MEFMFVSIGWMDVEMKVEEKAEKTVGWSEEFPSRGRP